MSDDPVRAGERRGTAPAAHFSPLDHAHMARALRLAERGLFTTQPNPRVGCVLAHGAQIVGEGWHERAGEPHAEVFALRAAGARARGATAYVTLEPCAHFGRTPPCADALIAAGVARVVAACEDPNPNVAGGGFAKLRAAGIAVETGLLRDAAREVNRGFFSRLERGRPWLRVKLAQSIDGRTALADGSSQWITGEAARADVQRWRARSSAILTGSGTVLADNPRLTLRSLSPDGVGGEGWGEGAASADASRRVKGNPLTQPSPPSALGGEGLNPLRSLSPDGVGGEGWGEGAASADASRHVQGNPLTQPSPPSALGGEGLNPLRSLSPDGVGGEGWGEGVASADASRRVQGNLLTQPSPPSALGGEGFKPLRVVLDANLQTPPDAHVLDGSVPTLIFHATDVTPGDARFARVERHALPRGADGRLDLGAALAELAARGVNELQVEAGATLCGALFDGGWVDELLLYVAPVLLGDTARPLLRLAPLGALAQAKRLRVIEQRAVGTDLRILLRE